LPEALETWPVDLIAAVLPRHLQIIYEINHRFLRDVMHRHPGDVDLLRRMSVIDESPPRSIRMAHLAIVGCHKVNGVSRMHTSLMQERSFQDFDRFFPNRIINLTNGISPRRWLPEANPALAQLITARISSQWICDLDRLKELANYADDEAFQAEFRAVKSANKRRLTRLMLERLNVSVDPQSMFDMHPQTDPRIQTATAECDLYHHPLQPRSPPRRRRHRAAYADFLRQDRARLRDCEAYHPPHQSCRRYCQPRSKCRRTAENCFYSKLRCSDRRGYYSRCGPISADFHGRHGGVRYRQHEARAQWRADDRHPRRCQ
jgi:hypothetical protein